MAENGILDYQGMNQAIYRGATSNIVVDTQSMSIEIGAGNASHTSNLHFECNHDANVASIKLNSNVTTEFSRSKKLIKYPRVIMTNNTTGGYVAEASSEETSAGRYAWKVFNHAYAESNGWRHDTSSAKYSTSGWDGNYIGNFVNFSTGSAQTFAAADQGEWIKIGLPVNEKMQLKGFTLQPRLSTSVGPGTVSYGRSEFIKNGTIWGSNDGASWDRVYTIKGAVARENKYILSFNDVNSNIAYRYFVLVITDNYGGTNASHTSLSEWQLFGVPEYDPDAHGTNVTIKSVANSPNTDFMEVYYDAKNYTTGSVQDETSNNRDATLDGVVYDSVSKSFTFDGNDKMYTGAMALTPTSSYTASLWFKVPELSSGQHILFQFGHGSNGEAFGMNIKNGDLAAYVYGGSTRRTRADLYIPDEWVHATCIANNDGIVEIYFNGRLVMFSNTGQALTIPSNPYLSLGIHFSGERSSWHSGEFLTGSVANFRLFNRPLSTGEIYQLYVYQKEEFGHGDLSMTLKSGRLGIGTYEPQTELDVRGEVKSEIQTVIQSETLDDNQASNSGTPHGRARSRRDIQGSMFVSKYFKTSAGAWKAGWPVPNGADASSIVNAQGEATREQLVLAFEGDEGAFLAMGGDGMTISNPGDHGALSFFDEDGVGSDWNGSWTSSTGRPTAGWHITPTGSIQSGSDIRLKENIEEYNPENILDKIKNVELITFTMKPPKQEIAYKRKYTERQTGVSAQNMQTLFPEYIDDQGDFLQMNYTRWPIANTAAIKELIKIIENQQNTINNLLERVSTLENQ